MAEQKQMTEQRAEDEVGQKTGDKTENRTEDAEDSAEDGGKLDQGSSTTNPSADIASRSLGATTEGAESGEDEFEKCKKQAEEYLDNWKRERADFINYKKEEAKRLEEFVKFAAEDVILEIIEILDDLEAAVKHNGRDIGLENIIKKFTDLLTKYGVEKIKVGNKFDPAIHEAVESEGEGEIIEEVRAGYSLRGRVIRPARVRIIK